MATLNDHTWRDISMEIIDELLDEMPEEFHQTTVHECGQMDYNHHFYKIGFEFNLLERRSRDKIFTRFDQRVIWP